jgi:hypothetical protein
MAKPESPSEPFKRWSVGQASAAEPSGHATKLKQAHDGN